VPSGLLVFWRVIEKLANWADHPHTQQGRKGEGTNYRGISLLSLPGKVYAMRLEKRCREIIEHKLGDSLHSAVFVLVTALQTKFSLSSKFSRNLGSTV